MHHYWEKKPISYHQLLYCEMFIVYVLTTYVPFIRDKPTTFYHQSFTLSILSTYCALWDPLVAMTLYKALKRARGGDQPSYYNCQVHFHVERSKHGMWNTQHVICGSLNMRSLLLAVTWST